MPKNIKDGGYVKSLGEYKDVGTHWVVLYCKKRKIVYFDSFGVEHIPEKLKSLSGIKI